MTTLTRTADITFYSTKRTTLKTKTPTRTSKTSVEETGLVLREKKERERKERERKERERKIRLSQLERCKRRVMANSSHTEVRRKRQLKKCEKNAL